MMILMIKVAFKLIFIGQFFGEIEGDRGLVRVSTKHKI
jgi:hypothetical protein